MLGKLARRVRRGVVGKRDRHSWNHTRRPALPRKPATVSRRRERSAGGSVAVHQVTGLKELGKPGPGQPTWATLMAKMRRKTLIVCAPCHDWIHANPVAHAA